MKKTHWPFYHLNILGCRVLQGHILCNVQFCLWLSLFKENFVSVPQKCWLVCSSICWLPKMKPQGWKPYEQTCNVFLILHWDLHSRLLHSWMIRIADMGKTQNPCWSFYVFSYPFLIWGKHDGDSHCLFILLFEICSCACCSSHVAFWYWYSFIFAQNP